MTGTASVEAVFGAHAPGPWRRLTLEELRECRCPVGSGGWAAGWHIELPDGTVGCPSVDHLLVLLDKAFPHSQPRVAAPQVVPDYSWPHVEQGGLLCLRRSVLSADPGERVREHLNWSLELLNYPAERCRQEFEREFSAYWQLCASSGRRVPYASTLLSPSGSSQDIFAYVGDPKVHIIASEGHEQLVHWLRNSGYNPRTKDIVSTWLIWLARPWVPAEFPSVGSDILRLIPEEKANKLLRPGQTLPVIIGTETRTGAVFACVLLQSAPERELVRGFRNVSRVPKQLISNSFSQHPIIRCRTIRVDGMWVHGRDHNRRFLEMSSRRVALIGCGALGGFIGRLLAQAGVSDILAIDGDSLSAPNTSRHILGQQHINVNKAEALCSVLRSEFPHIRCADAVGRYFGSLDSSHLTSVSTCDVIVTAGIDIEGDAQLDKWRRGLRRPPIHVCTWVEPFALVGHAIALVGNDSLMQAFDKEDRVQFRLTEWPDESRPVIAEAGCGNLFQPHGAADLQTTVSMATELILDALHGAVNQSIRRVWQGDIDRIHELGGEARPEFDASDVFREHKWIFGA